MSLLRWVCFVLLAALWGCSGSSATQSASKSAGDADEVASETASKKKKKKRPPLFVDGVPRRCGKKRGECLPPQRWVQRLCDDLHPDVALHMFRPGTPWQRFYMLARAEPFNASGGMSLLGDKLEPGEEVLALRRRGSGGQFQVGDQEGYDVLRWNGACATIHDGDFARSPFGSVRHSKLEWRRLGLDLRLKLETDPDIAEAYEERRKECRGIAMGRVSAECEELDKQLMDEIVRYVLAGNDLPPPSKAPKSK